MESVVDSLVEGMDNVFSTKTVVGNPMQVGDVTILPLMDVSFGFGAGGSASTSKGKAANAGGMGGKMSPCAVLVIKDGTARIVNVKAQDSWSKVIDMIPDLVDKISGKMKSKVTDEEIIENAFPENTDI